MRITIFKIDKLGEIKLHVCAFKFVSRRELNLNQTDFCAYTKTLITDNLIFQMPHITQIDFSSD